MTTAGFLTPVAARPEVSVPDWIALQGELLRDAVARGDPAAAEVLRFADVAPSAARGGLDLASTLPTANAVLSDVTGDGMGSVGASGAGIIPIYGRGSRRVGIEQPGTPQAT